MADSTTAVTTQRFASGGSGSTSYPASRSSAPNLLFAIPLLLVALSLLTVSRRSTRLRSCCGLGLCGALLAWALTVSRQGAAYLVGDPSSLSANANDLAIWGITAALFVLAALLGATLLWPLGLAALAVAAGFAFALSFLLLGSHGLIPSQAGRWAWIAIWALASLAALAFVKPKHRQWVELIQACITGAFLFSISIDLLANGAEGASLGLRWILDTNSAHLAVLSYSPKLSTQLLMPLSWIIAPISAYVQYRLFPIPQEWPSHTWFQQSEKEGVEDEGTDQTPTLVSSTDSQSSLGNTDPEKALSEKNGNAYSSNLPALSQQDRTNSDVTLTPDEGGRSMRNSNTTFMVNQVDQTLMPPMNTLRRPAAVTFRRSQSYPSSSSSSPTLHAYGSAKQQQQAALRNQRNSSAYPLPSLSQLMAYHGLNTDGTPSQPPPNARGNSRRMSAVPYSIPPLPLGAHEEDHQAEDGRNCHREMSVPIIQVIDGDEALLEEERSRKISDTNRSEHSAISSISNISSTPTATTAFESLPDTSTATTATAVEEEEETGDNPIQPLNLMNGQPLSVPMEERTAHISSSSSGTNGESLSSSTSRNSSLTSLQTSISSTETSQDKIEEKVQHVGNSSKVLYQDSRARQGSTTGFYLEKVTMSDSRLEGIVVAPETAASVVVRSTMDNWQSYIDTASVPASKKNEWYFNINLDISQVERTMQIALCTIDKNGREEWDSNNGENYIITV